MQSEQMPGVFNAPWTQAPRYSNKESDRLIRDASGAWIATTGGNPSNYAALIAAAPDMLATLADVELRCTQARIASTIGKKKDASDFLRGELERIAQEARAAITKATQ